MAKARDPTTTVTGRTKREPKIQNIPVPKQPEGGVKLATKVNFAAVADFEALQKGEYPAVFTVDKIDNSKNTGQPTLYAEYLIQDTNQKIFKAYSLQAKALWVLKRDLVRIGADIETMNSENADLDDITAKLSGAACTVIVDEPHYYPVDANGNSTPESKLQTTFKEVKDPTRA